MAVEIKHLAGAEEAIDDNTRIVRYMKLSTLLLLLADRVFLPSLRCLQSYDKLEGVLPQRLSVFQDYGTQLYPKVQPFEDWLLQQAKSPKVIPVQGGKHTRTTLHFLTKVWAEQLAIRRCVWCWNKHSGQSYALWEIYGKRGVALVTTVGAVKRALEKAGVLRAIVSPVSYSIPPGFLLEEDFFEEAARQSIQMVRKENLAFPYLFKDGGYKYEQEVRFVFGVHPNLLRGVNGVVIKIDGKCLVKSTTPDLWVSPDIPKEEKNMIRYLVADIRKGACPECFPYPAEQDEDRLMRFNTVGGSPFTMADEPPGLFWDLFHQRS